MERKNCWKKLRLTIRSSSSQESVTHSTALKRKITALEKGSNFSFTIPCKEAYGERDEDNVRQVPKSMFNGADGKFDSENIFPGNIIMLNDAEEIISMPCR